MIFRSKGIPRIKGRRKVKESIATRAIFVAGGDELHKIALTFNLDDGTTHEYELNLVDTGKLITQLKASYSAALPKHHRESFQ